ncbi:hypothetical protein ACUSRR_004512, partial [Vibrio alginolyticus]|nr:hypothetical protein [Vibrio alginolyticus]
MLSQFEIPEKEMITVRLVQAHFERELTAREFLSMTDDDFLEVRGLGRTKLVHIATLREILSAGKIKPTVDQEPATFEEKASDSLTLSKLALPHVYKATCNLLCQHLGEALTVGELRRLEESTLRAIPSLGTKKVALIKEMLTFIDSKDFVAIGDDGTSDQNASRQLYNQREDIDLSTLEELLTSDLESFLEMLGERDKFIMVARLGYQTEPMTLQEVGDSLPTGKVTRERVRQLQVRLEKNWHAHMRVAPSTLWVNVRSNLSVLRAEIFPRLQKNFSHQKGFYEFLEMSCGLESGGLTKIVYPDISTTVLDDYWAERASPSDLETVTSYLQDRLGIEKAVAENAVSHLSGNKVELLGELVLPMNLSKPLAIANTLLDHPEGLTWKSLHKKANEKAISRVKLPEERLDGAIGHAVDTGWVYQIDRGSYRHINFLNITEEEITQTLGDVKRVLQQAAESGRDSLNLSVDYYQSLSEQALDYFTVRHIVRTHGEREGIFFNGKSGADTISLEQDFSLAGQESVLEALFANSDKPLDKAFIASKIRSQSVGHASFYLDKLLTKGVIVRVDEAAYQSTAKAFLSVDVASIMDQAAKIIESEERVIEAGIIQRKLNKLLDLDLNKYFYLSLLKSCHVEFGYQWHFTHNLVCKREIPFESLSDICRSALETGGDFDGLAQEIAQVCWVDDARLKVALGQNSIKKTSNKCLNVQ